MRSESAMNEETAPKRAGQAWPSLVRWRSTRNGVSLGGAPDEGGRNENARHGTGCSIEIVSSVPPRAYAQSLSAGIFVRKYVAPIDEFGVHGNVNLARGVHLAAPLLRAGHRSGREFPCRKCRADRPARHRRAPERRGSGRRGEIGEIARMRRVSSGTVPAQGQSTPRPARAAGPNSWLWSFTIPGRRDMGLGNAPDPNHFLPEGARRIPPGPSLA